MLLRQICDDHLAQYAYLLGCQQTGEALIVDPQRDIDRYVEVAESEGMRIVAVLETHIHADFLSGASEFARQYGTRLYLSGEGGEDWQYGWAAKSDYEVQLLRHGDSFHIGGIELRAMHTAGHTPEHLSLLVTDLGGGAEGPIGLLSGDFVFVGDLGRPDLLESAIGEVGAREPAAAALYRSLSQFVELPEHLQVWPAHGAGSACGKALGAVPMSTVGYEKRNNAALKVARQGETAFVDAILDGQPEPPAYFARMKRLNRDGPQVLRRLPKARDIPASYLDEWLDDGRMTVVDTRPDRRAFMAGHLPDSLHAPFDRSFTTIVGSFVEPEERLILIIDEADLEAAIRALVRVGIDRIPGILTPESLDLYRQEGGTLRSTEVITGAELEARGQEPDHLVLDVRGAAEYAVHSVPGALNVAHTVLLSRLSEIPQAKTLVVHCRTGGRAASAVSFLERRGHQTVWVDGTFEPPAENV